MTTITIAIVKERGYPDWFSLAEDILKSLPKHSCGGVTLKAVHQWLKSSLGVTTEDSKELIGALINMEILEPCECDEEYNLHLVLGNRP